MNLKKLSKIFKALSNENRLELFLEIARTQDSCFETEECRCYITEIMCSLDIGAPTVSHHIKELTNADLITTERKGKFLVAKINMDTIEEITDIFNFDFNKEK